MTNKITEIFHKIEDSFKSSLKGGEENLSVLIRWWGLVGYLFFYFVIEKLIIFCDIQIIDIIFSSFGIIYFSWHIYALIKCSPKKPKLSKEEKQKLRSEAIHNAPKAFMRKLFLQESISKWNPVKMEIVTDLLFVAHFIGYLIN